jgi:hypothetical protein
MKDHQRGSLGESSLAGKNDMPLALKQDFDRLATRQSGPVGAYFDDNACLLQDAQIRYELDFVEKVVGNARNANLWCGFLPLFLPSGNVRANLKTKLTDAIA